MVTLGAEDPMSPRPTLLMKTPVSVFARTIGGTPKSPLTAPFTPELDSPFKTPTLRHLTTPAEQCSPWSGTLQSPHVMRTGVKLWSTSTGEGCHNLITWFEESDWKYVCVRVKFRVLDVVMMLCFFETCRQRERICCADGVRNLCLTIASLFILYSQ